MDAGNYTWMINDQLLQKMKNAKNKDQFVSDTFRIAELNWRAITYPNGKSDNDQGSFEVSIESLSLPKQWESINVRLSCRCNESQTSYTNTAKYTQITSLFTWGENRMILAEIEDLNQLSISINIKRDLLYSVWFFKNEPNSHMVPIY